MLSRAGAPLNGALDAPLNGAVDAGVNRASNAPASGALSQQGQRCLPNALLGSRYRLKSVIGSGRMATVWRAHDELLDRTVAVKVMSDALSVNPDYVTRFELEARTAASISHANLVQIYDFSAAAGRPFLVMEYLEGGTLEDRLARGAVSAEALRGLACDLLAAIACVHRAGVLHRDINLASVLLDIEGRARLTDFGITRLQAEGGLTVPEQMRGTLRFLAPELLRGARPSRRSDLYALGILLQEVPLTGAPDSDLSDLIDRMTAPCPEQRPRDAVEALARLRAAIDEGQPTEEFQVLDAPDLEAGAPAAVDVTNRSTGRRPLAAAALRIRHRLATTA